MLYTPINNVYGLQLASPRSVGGLSLVLLSGQGARVAAWPTRVTVVTAGTYGTPTELLTVFGVTEVVGDTLTITGPLEGTVDRDYFDGDWVDLRVTAGYVNDLNIAVGGKNTWVLGAGTPVTVATDKTAWAIIDQNRTPTKAYISAKTAPVGASLIVDILLSTNSGVSFTSLWAVTPANRPTLTTGNNYGTVIAFDTTSLPEGGLLRIDVIQVGSIVQGQDITVQLQYQ